MSSSSSSSSWPPNQFGIKTWAPFPPPPPYYRPPRTEPNQRGSAEREKESFAIGCPARARGSSEPKKGRGRRRRTKKLDLLNNGTCDRVAGVLTCAFVIRVHKRTSETTYSGYRPSPYQEYMSKSFYPCFVCIWAQSHLPTIRLSVFFFMVHKDLPPHAYPPDLILGHRRAVTCRRYFRLVQKISFPVCYLRKERQRQRDIGRWSSRGGNFKNQMYHPQPRLRRPPPLHHRRHHLGLAKHTHTHASHTSA